MKKKIQMVCKRCGSTEVRRNADAVWNVKNQRWELCVVFDSATCEQCETDCIIYEKDVP
jgi:hypothetical protein